MVIPVIVIAVVLLIAVVIAIVIFIFKFKKVSTKALEGKLLIVIMVKYYIISASAILDEGSNVQLQEIKVCQSQNYNVILYTMSRCWYLIGEVVKSFKLLVISAYWGYSCSFAGAR